MKMEARSCPDRMRNCGAAAGVASACNHLRHCSCRPYSHTIFGLFSWKNDKYISIPCIYSFTTSLHTAIWCWRIAVSIDFLEQSNLWQISGFKMNLFQGARCTKYLWAACNHNNTMLLLLLLALCCLLMELPSKEEMECGECADVDHRNYLSILSWINSKCIREAGETLCAVSTLGISHPISISLYSAASLKCHFVDLCICYGCKWVVEYS